MDYGRSRIGGGHFSFADPRLVGGPGNDKLAGGSGNDELNGIDGVLDNDSLNGGFGTDTCDSDPDSESRCEV